MRSIFTIISIIVGILSYSASFSQTASQSWYRQINVPQSQPGPFMARDNSGNVYLAATIVQNSTPSFYIMKYNSSGTQVWAVTYAGTFAGGVRVVAIAVDASSNIIVSGTCTDANGHSAIQTVKYNSAGSQVWSVATQAGLQYSLVTAITTDPAGNVLLAGSVLDNANYSDFLVVKLNVDGVQQWVGKYNGSALAADFATAVTADASGNVYVTGTSAGQIIGRGTRTPTGNDYLTIKYSPSGVAQWINRYYTTSDDQPCALVVDAAGNVYVTGYTNGGVGTTVAYSSTGAQLWVSQPPGAKFNKSIARDA
ncbi:MAG: SBBP repeat-containing protein [Bacteroidetes bacterium]|nr:SBBP repeat-containing protein [Bacteroidota bacterium]